MDIFKGHPLGTFWYSHSNKLGFVNIPKNASTTAKALFRMAYADARPLNIYDHNFMWDLHLDEDVSFFAYTRDEFDRYISGVVEYEVRNKKDVYDLVANGIFTFDEHTAPQQWFLHPFTGRLDIIDMYKMYEYGPLCEMQPIPRQNPSKDPLRKAVYLELFRKDPNLKRIWDLIYDSRLL
jgi:hypothetical protein